MNPVIEQIVTIYKDMTLLRKIVLGVLILMMVAGFATMFIWANRTEFRPAYSGLSEADAAAVVAELKAANTPYRLENNGTTILVPAGLVYEVRLSMARVGIPKGSGVGYEIFDQTDFGTTEFVQKINKKRALQGELARTIRAFDEVKEAKVMIVLPKDSVFVEETKKPSASILLELESDLDPGKVAAVAHLVASSVEDLKPKLVTIVDTAGRILFEGKSEEEKIRIEARNLADAQYRYKVRYEKNIADRIQTMLERIVGKDKAIVRVTSELDFSTSSVNEEIYDPLERETDFVRSKKILSENSRRQMDLDGEPSSVNPVVPPGEEGPGQGLETVSKSNDTVNYELSRRTRQTVKPMALLQRLSVAAVVDGTYAYKTDESGNTVKTYVPRSQDEMRQFHDIVVKAMGYDEARRDQVSMECFPFASIDEIGRAEPELKGWRMVQKEYGRTIANVLLVVLLFLLVIRPIIKTVRGIKDSVEQKALPGGEGVDVIEGGEEDREPEFKEMSADDQKHYIERMTESEKKTFFETMSSADRDAYLDNLSLAEKAAWYANHDIRKTANIIKGWLSEIEEKEEE
ncbi:MAG: flagellar basal-body MS-ring/collar protein FliF [Thermodesulfobacteriota bacterium]|nr:flagellar basal-body MS-ring/collar protein FliF [Thermodesulfobacteriota bacterium]